MNKKVSKYCIIAVFAAIISLGLTVSAYLLIVFQERIMKNYEKQFFISSLIFTLILPFITISYMLKYYNAFLLITLIVNIVALIIVIYCFIKGWKK